MWDLSQNHWQSWRHIAFSTGLWICTFTNTCQFKAAYFPRTTVIWWRTAVAKSKKEWSWHRGPFFLFPQWQSRKTGFELLLLWNLLWTQSHYDPLVKLPEATGSQLHAFQPPVSLHLTRICTQITFPLRTIPSVLPYRLFLPFTSK